MDASCPKRKCRDLKKVSLPYEAGFFQAAKRVQFCCLLLGSGRPEFLVESSTTKGSRQPTLGGRSGRVGTCLIYRHSSPHWLSFELFVVAIPNPRVTSKILLAARLQNRVRRRAVRAES